jgi:ketosteroid isomerase-like protein
MNNYTEEIKDRLNGVAQCVLTQDFEKAKTYFHDDVYCFGSYEHCMTSLDDLVKDQWMKICPNISDFKYDFEHMHCQFSNEGKMACVMLPWSSTGYHDNGTPFERLGRVTFLFRREDKHDRWRVFHSHYSLKPGTPIHTAKPETESSI